jgi:hypothetical protein
MEKWYQYYLLNFKLFVKNNILFLLLINKIKKQKKQTYKFIILILNNSLNKSNRLDNGGVEKM